MENPPELPASVTPITLDGRQIYVVGTAHVSPDSVEDVRTTVERIEPDAICVELCPSRHQALTQRDNWRKMDIFRIIKKKKAILLLVQLILSSFYRRLGERLGVQPGAEMLEGIKLAERLEPYKLFWLEEVSRPFENLAAINKVARMPTAGGESIFGIENYFRYISSGAVDIIMPDIKYCGGMMELKKIAAMAEGAGMKTSPHGPASPVGGMAAAHVCATLPNFQVLEHSHGEIDWRAELVDPPEQFADGRLTVPDRPGIGYTLNDATIRRNTP